MQRYFTLCLLAVFITACGPSPEQIATQTASAATAIAVSWTKTPTPTATATPTFTPTATPTQTLTATSTPTPAPIGLGVTRAEVQAVFEPIGLVFGPPEIKDGQTSVTGQYVINTPGKEIAVLVTLTGPEENLQEAFVGIMLPLKTPANAQPEIASYMTDLLKATVPQWKEGSAWLNTNLANFSVTPSVKTTVDRFTANLFFVVFNETNLQAQTYSLRLSANPSTAVSVTSTPSQPLPTVRSGWTSYQDAMISFAYPQAWEVQKTTDDPLCQQAECLLDIKSPDHTAHLGLMRAVVAGDLDTEAFDARLWELRTKTINDINLESKKMIQVGALSAVERVFSETDPLNEPQKAYVVNVIFVKKPYTYTFVLSATTPADRDKAMADLAEMIASVQIGP